MCNYQNGYFTHSKLTGWQEEYLTLFNDLRGIPVNEVTLAGGLATLVPEFVHSYEHASVKRTEFNEALLRKDAE